MEQMGLFEQLLKEKQAKQAAASPFAHSSVVEMLSHMRNQCSVDSEFSREKRFIGYQLDWFIKQAMLPVHRRDRKELQTRWEKIQRGLTKFGMLQPFRAEPMHSKIDSFLKGETYLFDFHKSS